MPNGLVNLAKEIPRQNVKNVSWLLIVSYGKTGEGGDKLKFKEQEKSPRVIQDSAYIIGWKINLYLFSIFSSQNIFF